MNHNKSKILLIKLCKFQVDGDFEQGGTPVEDCITVVLIKPLTENTPKLFPCKEEAQCCSICQFMSQSSLPNHLSGILTDYRRRD